MLGDGHFKLLLYMSVWGSYKKKIRKNISEGRGWLFFPYSCAFAHTTDKLIFAFTASLVAQTVKNLPAMQETWVQFLSWEEPLEKQMAPHSSILARRVPSTEEPGGPQRVSHDRATNTVIFHRWALSLTDLPISTALAILWSVSNRAFYNNQNLNSIIRKYQIKGF